MENNTYYLYLDTWVNQANHGLDDAGLTQMLNDKGNSCCLGQFAAQRGVSEKDLSRLLTPINVAYSAEKAYDSHFVEPVCGGYEHTKLSKDLLAINDEPTHLENSARAEKLKKRMEKDGLTLVILDTKPETQL